MQKFRQWVYNSKKVITSAKLVCMHTYLLYGCLIVDWEGEGRGQELIRSLTEGLAILAGGRRGETVY